ncbi:MAG: hypothetical protein ISS69_07085 [Phycisphaerae bacterium]|nr:hypothetical protein [Phycisphaerae bacterium]
MPSSDSGQPQRPADSAGDLGQLPAPVASAIKTFAAAAKTRRIENICSAYQTLKSSVNGLGMDQILPLADSVLGQSTIALIVSAYSHERCFMCINGAVPCEACSEEDAETRSQCPHCNSTGMVPCEFCDGTGWVGNDVIPRELHRAVWRSRLKHTHHSLEKYAAVYTHEKIEALSRQPAGNKQRCKAIMSTNRLAAKLHALARSCAVGDPEHIRHLNAAERKVRNCLTVLSGK